MSATIDLAVYREDLAQIVRSVFRTMMDLDVTLLPLEWTPAGDTITSAIQFVGVWHGGLLVECHQAGACQFTARFIGIDPPAALNDDVRDVVGELGNMVAGNMKSLLPKGVDISMPYVVEGADYAMYSCGAQAMEQLTFRTEAGDFRITLVECLPAS